MNVGIIDSAPKIITNGLVLHLDAAQKRSYSGTGTTWTDLSGKGNNGTLVNGPTFNSGNGGSIVFDGTNDYVGGSNLDNLSSTLGGSSGITISMWVKRNVVSSGTSRTLIGFTNTSQVHKLLINFNPTDKIIVLGRSALEASGQAVTTINSFTSTISWYYVTGIWLYGSNTILCYVNGVLEATTGTVSFSQSTLLSGTSITYNRIGSEGLGATLFPGNISSTKVYNRALSDAEVLQNYNATKSRFGL